VSGLSGRIILKKIMKATTLLKDEHLAIKDMLLIMDVISQIIEKGCAPDLEHLEKIIDFLKVFADKCHHGKEEDILFPAMLEKGIPREGGPIGVMLHEHELGRGYIRGLADAVQSYKLGHKDALKLISLNINNYSSLLFNHIEKEDNILYVLADKVCPPLQQEELAREFEKIELERIGAGGHKAYYNLIRKLKEIYLK
jgi:hemerythrin-like domain-containing protein